MEPFLVVTAFLFAPALYPWFMHPTTKKRPDAKWILLALLTASAGIAAIGYSAIKAVDAPILLCWWLLLLTWSVTATVARIRHHRIKKRKRKDQPIRDRFEQETRQSGPTT